MLNRHLIIILLALMSLQSLMAMADAHQYHEQSSQHVDTSHTALTDTSGFDTHIDVHTTLKAELDGCNHCCHCHGGGLGVLNAYSRHYLPSPNQTIGSRDSVSTIVRPSSSPFRPPKT